ncbi:MAG: hypothetical protein ACK5LV_03415 [Lachnospirales bacterium]
MKVILINAFIAGLFGFAIGFLLNLFAIPMPTTVISNAMNNGIGGFLSGFIGVTITLIILQKQGKFKHES